MKTIESFECPDKHYDVVSSLLAGKFIIYGDTLFDVVNSNLNYYVAFFELTYKYELIKTSEVIYISSQSSAENFSKEIMLILAVIAYELNLQGKNLYEELFASFTIKSISELIASSSYAKVCKSIDIDKFFSKCERRNLVKVGSGNTIRFTSAIKIFLEHAKKISEIDDHPLEDGLEI